jgi:hypothetical protein
MDRYALHDVKQCYPSSIYPRPPPFTLDSLVELVELGVECWVEHAAMLPLDMMGCKCQDCLHILARQESLDDRVWYRAVRRLDQDRGGQASLRCLSLLVQVSSRLR